MVLNNAVITVVAQEQSTNSSIDDNPADKRKVSLPYEREDNPFRASGLQEKRASKASLPVFKLQKGTRGPTREIFQNGQHLASPAEVSVVTTHSPLSSVGRLLL